MYRPITTNSNENLKSHKRSIAADVILTLLTCGFFGFYWKYTQFRAINALLGTNKYSFWKWFLLTIITCGIYYIYNTWAVAQDVVILQKSYKLPESSHLSLVSSLLAVFGFAILSEALVQKDINNLIEHITKPTLV